MNQKINITYDDLLAIYYKAIEFNKLDIFAEISLQWAAAANKEIELLNKELLKQNENSTPI